MSPEVIDHMQMFHAYTPSAFAKSRDPLIVQKNDEKITG